MYSIIYGSLLVFTLRHYSLRWWTKTLDCQSDSFVFSTRKEVISFVIAICREKVKTTNTNAFMVEKLLRVVGLLHSYSAIKQRLLGSIGQVGGGGGGAVVSVTVATRYYGSNV